MLLWPGLAPNPTAEAYNALQISWLDPAATSWQKGEGKDKKREGMGRKGRLQKDREIHPKMMGWVGSALPDMGLAAMHGSQ